VNDEVVFRQSRLAHIQIEQVLYACHHLSLVVLRIQVRQRNPVEKLPYQSQIVVLRFEILTFGEINQTKFVANPLGTLV
jgi:hypothetical protein